MMAKTSGSEGEVLFQRIMQVLGCILIRIALIAGVATPTVAQDAVGTLKPAELRLLQIGLIVSGDYAGRIDGEWGGGSRRAFADFARRRNLSDNAALTALVRAANAFVQEHGLAYRQTELAPVEFIASPGEFEWEHDLKAEYDCVNSGFFGGGEGAKVFVVFCESGFDGMAAWQDGFYKSYAAGSDAPYALRRADRWATAVHRHDGRVYFWAEPAGTRTWISIATFEQPGVDPALFEIAAASASIARGLALDPPKHGFIAQSLASATTDSLRADEADLARAAGVKLNNSDD